MPKRDNFMRYEDFSEDGFAEDRESQIVSVPEEKEPKRTGKGKRSLEDMMASAPNPEAQAVYAMERIASLEDQIAKILSLCFDDTLEIILKRRPILKRYAPEEEE